MAVAVKEELARLAVTRACCRRAEVCSLLRFADGLRILAGRVVVQAECDTGAVARRLRDQIRELYGLVPDIQAVPPGVGVPRSGGLYVVRVLSGGEGLARRAGLLDRRGRPIRGLPSPVISGGDCDAEAVWRGAFLAHGSLTETSRSPCLEVISPGPEAALALIGAARRLGVTAKLREVPRAEGERVVVRDADAIAALLTRLGAPRTVLAWQQHRSRRPVPITSHQPATFTNANHRRATQAAAEVATRVHRALEVLGDDIPDHLLIAGRLRLQHHQASLDELGQLADPPMTKDAIAGRIRRLLALADQHAHHRQVPDTRCAPPAHDPSS
ncbi:MAG: DNA-binding protein WhiA [Pseudonocardiales bacterium]|nr:MAG: DNA-binding protein WhiA [Pseudonocardiales bacterium]